jgi:hypothetical protein
MKGRGFSRAFSFPPAPNAHFYENAPSPGFRLGKEFPPAAFENTPGDSFNFDRHLTSFGALMQM